MEKGTRELHTAPDPTGTVPCPLRSREHIAMGRCVEYQRDNGCHCEHALTALRRTEKHLQSPTGLLTAYDTTARTDALDGVHALIERAESMEKVRPAAVPVAPSPPRRPDARPAPVPFIRPALAQTFREATRTEVAEAVLATRATRQKPATPAKESAVRTEKHKCNVPGCPNEFRSAKYDRCWRCRVGLTAHRKESSMPRRHKPDPCEKCKGPVDSRASGQVCGDCRKAATVGIPAPTRKAAPKPAPAKPAVKPLKTPTSTHTTARPAPIRSAPPADIISLLEHQLGHHEEQAEKCRKALQALR